MRDLIDPTWRHPDRCGEPGLRDPEPLDEYQHATGRQQSDVFSPTVTRLGAA